MSARPGADAPLRDEHGPRLVVRQAGHGIEVQIASFDGRGQVQQIPRLLAGQSARAETGRCRAPALTTASRAPAPARRRSKAAVADASDTC